MSNYDLLKRLGFDETLIEENKRLGLKEKPAQSMRLYMIEQAEARVAKYAANTYETKAELKEHTFKEEDNLDWKYVQIIPPPKKEMPQGERVQIDSLPKYARAAFGYTKALNQI